MAYSYNEVVATGAPQLVPVPPYIDQSHVKVSVNGVDTTNFSWTNAGTISVSASQGSKVRVYRVSSPAVRLVDYVDGVSINEATLDTDSLQAFYLAQEQLDAAADVLSKSSALDVAIGGALTYSQNSATSAGASAQSATNAATSEANALAYKNAAAASLAALFGGLRNKIINGTFRVNQRAVSGVVTLAAGKYGHDRWKAGAAGCTYSFATVGNKTVITVTAGSLMQVIDGENIEAGQYTLQNAGTAQARIGINGAAPSGAYAAAPLTTPAATGGQHITVEFTTGTLDSVQVEPGTMATAYERRPTRVEHVLCLAYWWPMQRAIGACGSSGAAWRLGAACPVPMRAPPSVSVVGAPTVQYGNTAPAVALLSISVNYNTTMQVECDCVTGNGGAPGGVVAIMLANASSYIAVDAEL